MNSYEQQRQYLMLFMIFDDFRSLSPMYFQDCPICFPIFSHDFCMFFPHPLRFKVLAEPPGSCASRVLCAALVLWCGSAGVAWGFQRQKWGENGDLMRIFLSNSIDFRFLSNSIQFRFVWKFGSIPQASHGTNRWGS